MQLKIAVPDGHINPRILGAALETATRANEGLLATGKIPSIKSAIKQGVRWRPEPPGTGEALDLAPTVLRRGWGDCDDLAPWLAAEMRLQGDANARAIAIRSGKKRWHAIVEDGQGRRHDPSLWAGMRGQVSIDGDPRITPLADPRRRALAVIPTGPGRWSARVDLPSRRHPLHVCAVAHADSPEAALIRAAQSAAYSAPSEADQLDAVVSGLCGVANEDGEQMGFLGDLVKTAGRVVSSLPVVGPVAQQVASVAQPLITTASRVVQPFAPVISAINPAAGIGLQSLPLAQSLLSALTSGGRVQGPTAGAVPLLPATPIASPQQGPTAAFPFPISPELLAAIAYQLTGGAPAPMVARW